MKMKIFFFIIIILNVDKISSNNENFVFNRRKESSFLRTELLTPAKLASLNGYEGQEHQYLSPDGYILTLHRIPRGRNDAKSSQSSRPVILLMPGVLSSSDAFVLNDPNNALGFYLADNGFDVWLGNLRGNFYVRNNTRFNPDKDPEFWNFSNQEMGAIDLPVTIDYILLTTGASKIHYLGFSSGATIFLILLSERPEFNDKISSATLVAPTFIPRNHQGLQYRFYKIVDFLETFFNIINFREIRGRNKFSNILASTLCSPSNPQYNDLCFLIYNNLIELDRDLVNQKFLPAIFSAEPSGSSVKNLLHTMQIRKADRFQKYDYGPKLNLKIYGTKIPPLYNLANVKVPVGIFYGEDDNYNPPVDVERLLTVLPNVSLFYKVRDPRFSHFDFLWSKNTENLLNDPILQFIRNFL